MSRWTVIVPVKPPSLAAPRLAVADGQRELLARAFFDDVLAVLVSHPAVGQIFVVTADARTGARARLMGATPLVDRPLLSLDGLNDAVLLGRTWAARRCQGSPVVVVPADLPALDATSLSGAFGALGEVERGYVPDAHGLGTTLVSSNVPSALLTRYGPRSASLHASEGMTACAQVDLRVRLDVDDISDLQYAETLGVGVQTSRVTAELRTAAHRA